MVFVESSLNDHELNEWSHRIFCLFHSHDVYIYIYINMHGSGVWAPPNLNQINCSWCCCWKTSFSIRRDLWQFSNIVQSIILDGVSSHILLWTTEHAIRNFHVLSNLGSQKCVCANKSVHINATRSKATHHNHESFGSIRLDMMWFLRQMSNVFCFSPSLSLSIFILVCVATFSH